MLHPLAASQQEKQAPAQCDLVAGPPENGEGRSPLQPVGRSATPQVDNRTGVVGRVFDVYKGPRSIFSENGSSPPVPPTSASWGAACRRQLATSERVPPTYQEVFHRRQPVLGPHAVHSPMENTFLAVAEFFTSKARRAGRGGVGGGGLALELMA